MFSRLPRPTGVHRVGTQVRHFKSKTRLDPFPSALGGPRELMLQLWYPADPQSRGKNQKYLEATALTIRTARLALLTTDSISAAPFVSYLPPCPVLVFVPSWRGQRGECTALAQEFASHGYVVIGIDHPGLSHRTVLPGGRICRAIDMPVEDYRSDESLAAFIKSAELQVGIRAADVREVLDAIFNWAHHDPESLLNGHLDVNRIGIFGFSIGGSTACEVCSVDPRLRAGMNMGGMIVENSVSAGWQKPLFFLFEDDPGINPAILHHPDPGQRRAASFGASQVSLMRRLLRLHGGYWLRIPGTVHQDLSDSLFLSPFGFLKRNSAVSAVRVFEIIRSAAIGFFNEQLGAGPAGALHSLHQIFNEVQFEEYEVPKNTDGSSPG